MALESIWKCPILFPSKLIYFEQLSENKRVNTMKSLLDQVWSTLPALEFAPHRLFTSQAVYEWLSRLLWRGFLPCCMIAHTPPLVSRATSGITPRKNMNVLDPFCLRREQLRGSNSNAGKMDQTWSKSLHWKFLSESRYPITIFFLTLCECVLLYPTLSYTTLPYENLLPVG